MSAGTKGPSETPHSVVAHSPLTYYWLTTAMVGAPTARAGFFLALTTGGVCAWKLEVEKSTEKSIAIQ